MKDVQKNKKYCTIIIYNYIQLCIENVKENIEKFKCKFGTLNLLNSENIFRMKVYCF